MQPFGEVNTLFIEENINNRLDAYQVYSGMPIEDLQEEIDNIMDSWNRFIFKNAPGLIKDQDFFVHENNLQEVIYRIDKRKVYYKVFHNLSEINELKQVALQCYWINTLKPFMVVNPKAAIYNSPNELFSVYLIISVVRRLYQYRYPNKDFKYPSKKRIADMVYNFKYCDLSREATIAFVETFADLYGVGIQYILDHIKKKK